MRDLTRHPRRGFTTIKLPAVRRGKRSAFTTIELLVVIGIILLLMGILIMGFRQWDQMASTKQTRAQLGICKNMLIEYERANGFKYIEGPPPQVTNPTPPPLTFPIYLDPVPPPNTYDTKAKLDMSPTSVTPTDMSSHSTGSPRYPSASPTPVNLAVSNTQQVMAILTALPANRTAISNIPANRLLEAAPGQPTPPINQAVILDGWGNPIIFVPAGGLIVNIKDPTNSSQLIPFVVRTSGTFPLAQLQQHPVTTLDRPFFASAGQDGSFTPDPMTKTGGAEDNVYSFQQD